MYHPLFRLLFIYFREPLKLSTSPVIIWLYLFLDIFQFDTILPGTSPNSFYCKYKRQLHLVILLNNFTVPGFVKSLFIQAVLGLSCCTGFSLVTASGSYSLDAVSGFLIAVTSLVAEQGLRSCGSRLQSAVVMAHGPSCPAAPGIFLDQGSSPWPLRWQVDSLPLSHQWVFL